MNLETELSAILQKFKALPIDEVVKGLNDLGYMLVKRSEDLGLQFGVEVPKKLVLGERKRNYVRKTPATIVIKEDGTMLRGPGTKDAHVPLEMQKPRLLRKKLYDANSTDKFLKLFEDGIPRNSRMLYQKFISAPYGNPKMKFQTFSGMLSPIQLRDRLLRVIKVPEFPGWGKAFYCLPEWMDGNKLKPEYMEKIRAAMLSKAS